MTKCMALSSQHIHFNFVLVLVVLHPLSFICRLLSAVIVIICFSETGGVCGPSFNFSLINLYFIL